MVPQRFFSTQRRRYQHLHRRREDSSGDNALMSLSLNAARRQVRPKKGRDTTATSRIRITVTIGGPPSPRACRVLHLPLLPPLRSVFVPPLPPRPMPHPTKGINSIDIATTMKDCAVSEACPDRPPTPCEFTYADTERRTATAHGG